MYTSIGCSCWPFCFFFFELCSAPFVFHHLKDNTGERGMSTTAMATTKVTVPCRHLPRPSKTIHLSERQRLSALHTIQLLRRGRPVPSSLSISPLLHLYPVCPPLPPGVADVAMQTPPNLLSFYPFHQLEGVSLSLLNFSFPKKKNKKTKKQKMAVADASPVVLLHVMHFLMLAVVFLLVPGFLELSFSDLLENVLF